MKTILLADDHKNIREFCRQELEDEGYRVITACDGAEGIELAQQELPDVVILDIRMPRKNGFEAAEEIKASEPRLPIIFLTSHDEDCMKDDRSLLAKACIEKREDLTELKHGITWVLESREANVPSCTELPLLR
jgi:CheY-like chemotaxis protein